MDEQRTSDSTWPHERCRSLDPVELSERISRLERLAEHNATAFVKNDLGQPDLDGHRRAHLQLLKAAQAMDDLKAEGAKKVVQLVIAFLAGIFALGISDYIRNPK